MDDAMLLRWGAFFAFNFFVNFLDDIDAVFPLHLCCYLIAIIRFLRARKFDLVKAKEMIIDCEKWRQEFGVEDIVK
jgi:hypothetical protein